MNFFRKQTAVETAAAVVATAERKRADLCLQLGDAERELSALKATAVDTAMEMGRLGDDDSEAIAALVAGVETLRGAVSRADAALVAARAELLHARDLEQRERSVREISEIQSAMEGPAHDLLAALEKIVPLARKGSTFCLDMKQLTGLLELLSLELPQSFAAAEQALKAHAASIKSGAARADLPAGDHTKPVATSAPAVPTRTIVLKYHAKWLDHRSNQARWGAPGWDCEMRAEIAQRAVDRGLAVWEFDEAAMKLRRERGGLISDQSALDLDNPAVAVPEKKDLWINPLHPRGPEVHSSSGQPGFGQPKPSSWMRPQTQPANGGDF